MKKLCVFLSVISAFIALLCLTYYSNLQNVAVDGDGFSGLAALGLGFFGLKKGGVV